MPLHPNIYLEVCHLINILDQFNHPLSAEIVDPDYKFILEAARFKSNGKNNYNPKEVPWRKTLSADPQIHPAIHAHIPDRSAVSFLHRSPYTANRRWQAGRPYPLGP